jgi:AraC-like DNA-binding protein
VLWSWRETDVEGETALIGILNGTKETVAYREHFGIRLFLNREAEDYPLHWHTAGEIIMPTENGYTVVVDGRTYALEPGDIAVLPPGELHELKAPASGERIILQFDSTLLYSLNGFDSAFHLLRPCCLISPAPNAELHRKLRSLLLELKDEYFSPSPLKEAAAYAKLILFFVELGRSAVHDERRGSGQKGNRKYHQHVDTFLRVCNYLNEHCTDDLEAEALAELAGYSKFHFTRLFKQYIGMSWHDYLNQHRIMHAEKLLVDPNLSVTEVAMRSGFGSLATFNRAFKAFKKCTPTQYKALHDSSGAGLHPAGSGTAAE